MAYARSARAYYRDGMVNTEFVEGRIGSLPPRRHDRHHLVITLAPPVSSVGAKTARRRVGATITQSVFIYCAGKKARVSTFVAFHIVIYTKFRPESVSTYAGGGFRTHDKRSSIFPPMNVKELDECVYSSSRHVFLAFDIKADTWAMIDTPVTMRHFLDQNQFSHVEA